MVQNHPKRVVFVAPFSWAEVTWCGRRTWPRELLWLNRTICRFLGEAFFLGNSGNWNGKPWSKLCYIYIYISYHIYIYTTMYIYYNIYVYIHIYIYININVCVCPPKRNSHWLWRKVFGETAETAFWTATPLGSWWERWGELSWLGYESIPINTIFRGMNIHLPAIFMFTRGTRFWPTATSLVMNTGDWIIMVINWIW